MVQICLKSGYLTFFEKNLNISIEKIYNILINQKKKVPKYCSKRTVLHFKHFFEFKNSIAIK